MTFINIDLRLVEISAELYALEDHLRLIEQQLDRLQQSEEEKLDISLDTLDPDDPERDFLRQQFYDRNEFVYPRYFRGTFLISLYAVYESAVIEIARLIQNKKRVKITIEDIRGEDFLDRAKKYFNHILQFELCSNKSWSQIVMLSEVRNAFAHTNGRIEMLREKSRKRLRQWSNTGTGIEINISYVTIKASFANKSFKCVQASLDDLIERYKAWDGQNPPNLGSSVR